MMSYMGIHCTYVLPVVGVLALIARPFLDRFETTKIAFISIVALVYTTLCYNFGVLNGARSYAAGSVSGLAVGNVPVEQYLSVAAQIVLTSLWAVLCLRWKLPFLNFNHDRRSYQMIRWLPILALSVATAVGRGMADPGRETFYLGCILCWASPAIAVMWYGAGNYFVRHLAPSCLAIAVPASYLLWVGRVALRENVWRLNETTSLNVFVADGLPLEEALFYAVTTAMVVLAGVCYDKAYGMITTYSLIYPHQFGSGWKFVSQMFRAFATPEYSMPSDVTDDLRLTIKVLENSNTLGTSTYLYHSGVRLDIIINYAFVRLTDNMVDDESSMDKKKLKLNLCQQFISDLFADRKSDYEVKSVPQEVNIDWTLYQSDLSVDEQACFRSMARIAFFLARKPYVEILTGFEMDLANSLYRNEKDLFVYFDNVAGSFSPMCMYPVIYRYNIDKYELVEKNDLFMKKLYKLASALQFVNIARDLVRDSELLGRCYIPTDYMESEVADVRILCEEKKPRTLGNDKLHRYAEKMFELANKHHFQSVDVIEQLPLDIRALILATVEIYRGIMNVIKSSPIFPRKAKVSRWNKHKIILKVLYVDSLQYLM